MKEKIKHILKEIMDWGIIVVIVGLIVGGGIWYYKDITHKEERDYNIEAVYDDVYAIYNRNTSNIPAYNYEVITIRIGNQEITYEGNVNIVYTNGTPKVHIVDTNIVYGDEITVYVPNNSVERLNNTSSSSR